MMGNPEVQTVTTL